MSWLDDSDNKVSFLPQVMTTALYPNTVDQEQGFFCSMLNGSAPVPEAPVEDINWDGLWNLDDVHGNFGVAASATRAGFQSLATPLF